MLKDYACIQLPYQVVVGWEQVIAWQVNVGFAI